MPNLHAGHANCDKCAGSGKILDRDTLRGCRACGQTGRLKEFHRVEVTDGQMRQLGFADGQKPHKLKLGCGMDACAYDVPGSDSVVKVTKDKRDAVVAAAVRGLLNPPLWAIPIRAVYRLRPASETFILVLARAEVPLPRDWSDYIGDVFKDTENEKKWGSGGLQAHEWHSGLGYDGWVKNIELANIMKGGENDERRKMRRAVDTINEMMLALKDMGIDGSDFHPGNWGMYQGRPVLIDFGMATLKDKRGKPIVVTGARLPAPEEIPSLPFKGYSP